MGKRVGRGGRRDELPSPSILTRAVDSVFDFVRFAEFEILFVLFFVVAYVIFKDLPLEQEKQSTQTVCLRTQQSDDFKAGV